MKFATIESGACQKMETSTTKTKQLLEFFSFFLVLFVVNMFLFFFNKTIQPKSKKAKNKNCNKNYIIHLIVFNVSKATANASTTTNTTLLKHFLYFTRNWCTISFSSSSYKHLCALFDIRDFFILSLSLSVFYFNYFISTNLTRFRMFR